MKLTSLFATLTLGLISLATAYTNPIRNPGGADPFITKSGDGYYYLLTTEWDSVRIARATTIEGLKTASTKVIYQSTASNRCCNVWAPEIQWMGDRWYLYFTAGGSANLDNQKLHVARGGVSAWDDSYTYVGAMSNQWSIDGSVLRFNAPWGNHFVYSCFNGLQYQSICIQKLANDNVSLTGAVYVISQPTASWERQQHPVNEGPAPFYMGGKTYLAISASYCWSPGYCLGLLTWNGGNPVQAGSWAKSGGCVFSSANRHYGTGHNSFFQASNGQIYNTFHATANANGACDDSRYTMVQPVTTNSNGSPNFGVPAPFSQSFAEPA
nr:hypothetical protein [Paramyrothecium sp.]